MPKQYILHLKGFVGGSDFDADYVDYILANNKVGSKFMQIAPKSNMLYGYDQMSDVESVMVKEFEPKLRNTSFHLQV